MQGAAAFFLLEAAYDLSMDKPATLRAVARAAGKMTPRGSVVTCTFDTALALPDWTTLCFERADERHVQTFHDGARATPLATRRLLLSQEPAVLSPSTQLIARHAAERWWTMARDVRLVAAMASTGDGNGLGFGFLGQPHRDWPANRLQHLHAITRHLAAAWRLRTALTDGPSADRAMVAELRVDGTVAEATSCASSPTARELLRRAVLIRERFRAGRRSHDERELWPALVAGRWSVVDAFTATGTRYVVAYENPVESAPLRRLSPREQQVLEHALAGRSGKWIALELTLSEPTVTRTIRSALRRLGAADLTALASARGARYEAIEGILEGGPLAVASHRPCESLAVNMSPAEREVVAALLSGRRIAAIARARGTSPWTVARQAASIYRKLAVTSRRELVARLR